MVVDRVTTTGTDEVRARDRYPVFSFRVVDEPGDHLGAGLPRVEYRAQGLKVTEE